MPQASAPALRSVSTVPSTLPKTLSAPSDRAAAKNTKNAETAGRAACITAPKSANANIDYPFGFPCRHRREEPGNEDGVIFSEGVFGS